MKLYRGLNLSNSEIEFIKMNGDSDLEKGAWLLKPRINHHNLSAQNVIEKILQEPENIERYSSRNSKNILDVGKYVTGCYLGASIYSNDSSKKENNVNIIVNVNLENIFIDGRDFLYTAIPKIIREQSIDPKFLNKLSACFGSKILDYIELSNKYSKQLILKDGNLLLRLVDYICMDKTIIKSHYKNNKILIKGRHSTRFFSAFAIIGGILPDMILEIKKSDPINRKTSLSLIQSQFGFIDTIEFNEPYQ